MHDARDARNSHKNLLIAAKAGNVRAIRRLLDAGEDMNAASSRGHTALMYAARKGHHLCVRELINNGAHVDDKDCDGMTALMIAVVNGFKGVVITLLEAGADVELRARDNFTPLMYASYRNEVEILGTLIQAGANTEMSDALSIACEYGFKQIAIALLKAGTFVNNLNMHGGTALMLASRFGQDQVCSTSIGKNRHVLTPLRSLSDCP